MGKVPGETEGSPKQTLKVTTTTLWVAPFRHHHTETFSGEMLIYLPKNIQREGKAGSKNWAKATAWESNMSKMIDLRKSTVKYAKTQDRPIYKHCHTFKPIDNRWVWGRCMVKWKGGQLSEPWRYQCIHDNPGSGTHPNRDHEQWSHRTWFPQGHWAPTPNSLAIKAEEKQLTTEDV